MTHLATIGTGAGNASSATLVITINRPVAVGVTLLMGLVWDSAGAVPTISSIVDTKSNTWTTSPDDSANSGSTVAGAIVRARVTTALAPGDTVTVTISAARTRWAGQIDAFDDLIASPLDAHTHGSGTSATPSTGTTGATVAQVELVYAVYGFVAGHTVTLPAGYGGGPIVASSAGSADRAMQATWLYVSSTGTQAGTITLDSSSAYAAAIATYKVLVPVPGPPDVPLFTPGVDVDDDPTVIADLFNAAIRDPLTYLLNPPVFRARRTGALAVTENSHQFVAWDQIDEDNYTGWGSSQTPSQAASRYVVPADGYYLVTALVSLSGTGAAGLVVIPSVAISGNSPSGYGAAGQEGAEHFIPAGASTQPKAAQGMWEGYAVAGQYFEIDLWYSTESAITAVDTTAGWQCAVEITRTGV